MKVQPGNGMGPWAIKTFCKITVGICKLDVTKIWCPSSDFSTAQRLTSPFAQCRGQHRLPSLQPGDFRNGAEWVKSVGYHHCVSLRFWGCHDVGSSPSLWMFVAFVRTCQNPLAQVCPSDLCEFQPFHIDFANSNGDVISHL